MDRGAGPERGTHRSYTPRPRDRERRLTPKHKKAALPTKRNAAFKGLQTCETYTIQSLNTSPPRRFGEHLKRLGAAVDLIAAPLPANPRCFMPGDRVRFINDQTFENCRFIVDYANEEWVYVSMEVAPVLKHRAKPEQLRLISPP